MLHLWENIKRLRFQSASPAYALTRLGRIKPTQQPDYRLRLGYDGMPRTHPRPPKGIIRKRVAGQRLQRSPRERSSVQRIPKSRLPIKQLKKKEQPGTSRQDQCRASSFGHHTIARKEQPQSITWRCQCRCGSCLFLPPLRVGVRRPHAPVQHARVVFPVAGDFVAYMIGVVRAGRLLVFRPLVGRFLGVAGVGR